MGEEEPLVTSGDVERELGIPRYALYRMVEAGLVHPVDDTKPWAKQRKRWKFRLSEVRAALGEPPAPSRT